MYGSSYGNCFELDGVCQIVLNTTFIFKNISADSIIYIIREKVHFELSYTYDRFFCTCQNAHIVQEIHDVADRDSLCSAVSNVHTEDEIQNSILGFIFEGHFLQTTVLFVLFKLTFWANGWKFPVWLILIFWGVGYLLRLAGEKLYDSVQKSIGTPECHILQKYISREYIQRYYDNPRRNWIANDIERE